MNSLHSVRDNLVGDNGPTKVDTFCCIPYSFEILNTPLVILTLLNVKEV